MPESFRSLPTVSADAALRLVDAAVSHARSLSLSVCVAVTDASGELVACLRMDDAPLGALRLAIDKAYTSAVWQMPSGDLGESSQPGGADWGITSTAEGRIVVYQGGFPILHDGQLAGAIGVSGGTSQQDAAVAQAALAVL